MKFKPDFIKAYNNAFQIQTKLQQFQQEAVAPFAQALHKQNEAVAPIVRALRKQNEMIADFGKAIELKPYFAQALHKQNEMIADFGKAIKLKLNFVYYNIDSLRSTLGKSEDTRENFDKAIELKPDIDTALPYLITGVKHLNEQEYSKAIDDLNASLQHGIRDGSSR